jgi:hypothetical protein
MKDTPPEQQTLVNEELVDQEPVDHEPADAPLLLDPKLWVPFVSSYLKGKPKAAECLASALAFTREAIQRGPEGVSQAVRALSRGIERAFRETREHEACIRLFGFSMVGFLPPSDELLALLNPAIKRAEAEQRKHLARQGWLDDEQEEDSDEVSSGQRRDSSRRSGRERRRESTKPRDAQSAAKGPRRGESSQAKKSPQAAVVELTSRRGKKAGRKAAS